MCHMASMKGLKYIIVVVDYFTKWDEAMPSFSNDGEATTFFTLNEVITRFGVPSYLIANGHGIHFQKKTNWN
jgi:hypothetical protein